MNGSPTRRQTLQLGGLALATSIAGCLGGDDQEGTLDFSLYETIDEEALPRRQQYATQGATFPQYRRYRADTADIVLILLHNSALDSRSVQPLATTLAVQDVAHVITPDLRGHGPDPEQRGDIDYLRQFEDDLKHLIDSIRGVYPDETLLIGGHGGGGGIAVRFAMTPRNSLADGYLLLAPYLGRTAPTTRPASGGWTAYYTDRMVLLRILTGFGIERYNGMEAVSFDIPDAVRDGTETPSYTYRLTASMTPLEHDALAEIENPCLTLVGSEDEACVPEAYESLLADHETAECTVVEDVSHLGLTLDSAAFEPIVDWLARFTD